MGQSLGRGVTAVAWFGVQRKGLEREGAGEESGEVGRGTGVPFSETETVAVGWNRKAGRETILRTRRRIKKRQ